MTAPIRLNCAIFWPPIGSIITCSQGDHWVVMDTDFNHTAGRCRVLVQDLFNYLSTL